MGLAGAVSCYNCPHPRATHDPGEPYRCRLNGCPCLGFVDREVNAAKSTERSVTFTIPDGYGFSVSFWPNDVELPTDGPVNLVRADD